MLMLPFCRHKNTGNLCSRTPPMPKSLQILINPPSSAGNTKALAEMFHSNTNTVDSLLGSYAVYKINPSTTTNPQKSDKEAEADGKGIFFLENQLPVGRTLKVNEILKTMNKASFLPRQIAQSIPFSSRKFPEIFNYFSVEPNSNEADLIKQTIQNCEIPAMKGEQRYCATSLESLIDWTVSKLGKNIQVLSNYVEEETENRVFAIARVAKKVGETEMVCHKLKYAYAVFLCHSIEKTTAYTVPLVSADGSTKAKLLAICHEDTSAWSPDHLAFQILKVKPGTVPVCHFLTKETLVWVPK
ncbi:sucrose-phosphate synthase 1 [Hibiscus syriacus]|uniref:Sucrose-phosphate synthase 1 n=1 Tax=Hibiscus syriacus TaxID=106335 RepID=A0A6A2YHJ3_HIBSY|nr:sucrose-phosphate synthase 1 [Hibiscus syriacus]